jgi:hypothetical protein
MGRFIDIAILNKALSADCGKDFVPRVELESAKSENERLRNAIIKHKQFVGAVNPNPCEGDRLLHEALGKEGA